MCRTSLRKRETVLPMSRLSVQEVGIAEAMRHKWIESEKVGHDLGESAIRCWVRHHWNGFLRAKWLEHLEGKTFWIELDQDDYGLLQDGFLDSPLIDEVIDRLKGGVENLDLISWGIDTGQNIDDLIRLLEVLDVNSRRIECLFSLRLAQAG